ncbi:hypothetical protein PDE_09793 [Penicillium oxalicum 114-2]|uniref:Uncharacterized protein n=1 Tax=Penicillium oxalicum (strain 114-2 / CGMCC 5302) TaxID=933388 RepID=S7ZWM4_PENO1|nr:hypothetical protein PDE_09793 [Penicillium oxalicum 114-2]
MNGAPKLPQSSCNVNLGDSFLEELPPSIKRYTYHGESQFFDILKSEFDRSQASSDASEFILFRASKETIQTLFQNEDSSPVAKYLSSFDTKEQLFLVKMTSVPHGVAPVLMHDMIMHAVQLIGLSSSLKGYANVKCQGEFRGKAADFSWGPKRGPRGRPSPRTVTLEVAYTENESKLNSDVRFWLDPDNGKANVCLTLRIGRSKPEIRVEKWEIQNDRIHRSQVIWVTKRGGQTYVSDALVISFESVFLRAASCPRERDLEISQEQLKMVAEGIWEEQCW